MREPPDGWSPSAERPPSSSAHWALVAATVAAAPAALAVETALRIWLLPADFETLRRFLSGPLTMVNWGLFAVTLLFGVLAMVLARRSLARARERAGTGTRAKKRGARARTGVFLWASSIPQVPAIVSTIGTLFGGSLVPTVAAIGVTTGFILALGRLR